MRFTTIITAITAAALPTLTGGMPLDARSDAPCRADQEFDLRCGDIVNVQMCDKRNGGYYWTHFRTCRVHEVCDETGPGDAKCKLYAIPFPACHPWCKYPNGTEINSTTVSMAKN